jgi:putative transposase
MRRSYRYRLYPTRVQAAALHVQVDEACRLYNAALDERRSAWRLHGISLNYYDQANQLRAIRAAGDCGVANFSACQDVLRRVEKTFQAFFRRRKAGSEQAGYPRFKPRQRYDSLCWPSWGDGCTLRPTGRLYLQGAGEIKVKWHRPLPADARINTVTVRRAAGRWYVCFSVEQADPEPLPESMASVGIDVGLTSFLVTNTGDEVGNPRHFRLAERALRRAQRKVARRQRRSRRRQKARQEVARLHAHIANQRRDFHHKTARVLVQRYGLLAVEDLNTKGLAGSMLAKSVHDAGWSQFLRILLDKASNAGRLLIAVNPAGTTQACSACGALVPKTLAERWHDCHACGLSLGRDHNAARNILHRALIERPGWGLQVPTVEVAHAVA